MYTEILFAIGAFCATIFWRAEAHLVIKDAVAKKIRRFRSLNELVATTESNKMKIIWISLSLIIRAIYISLIQYINNSVRHLDNKTSELTYVINGKMYKMIVLPKRGPAQVLQISNDLENDVTNQILPYMGPQYDWHGNTFTPEFFGFKSLTFELGDGSEYTYKATDHLVAEIITK